MGKTREEKSQWQEEQKKQERNSLYKKVGIWSAVVLVTIASLWGLILLTEPSTNTGSGTNNITPVSKNDIKIGTDSAKAVLIEYADFQCPACATNNPLIEQAVEEYKDKLLFVYRNFPLPQHNWAELAARIGVAAYNQGKFMEMSSELYQNQSEWESSSNAEKLFLKYAESLRLDMDKFKKDLASSETKNLIEAQKQEASQAGINSTPTIFLNKVKIQPRSYNDLKQLIENELKK